MNSPYRILAVVLLTSITFITAKAETINTTAELNSSKAAIGYIYSRPIMERLFRLGLAEDKKFNLQQDCKSQYQTIPVNTIILKPIVFTENSPNPAGGVWLTRYRIVRCGDEKIYNALVLADTTGGMPIEKSFFAGATNAGPQLVSDALRSAVSNVQRQVSDHECKTAEVFDMKVTEQPHQVNESGKIFMGVWKELWTLSFCGQKIDVPMMFIPDATGGGTSFVAGGK